MRELTQVFDARAAERVVIARWITWVLPYLTQLLTWNSYPSGPDYAGDSLKRLENLEKVEIFNGMCHAVAAVLAIVLVRSLTTAVRDRLTAEVA